ncbi:MAG: PocR ligand-binding domain-containing protein [Sporomusaceae bacterium]|nr:PocR ligand-binding domain-containing protein [Sporomusaceae bacterium]
MQNISRFSLDELVDIQVLQEIQDKYSEATGLAAVIVDANGKPITVPSNFSRFCHYLRSDPEGLARCMHCDDRGGRTAMELQRPVVYHCHCGLTDLAAPIIVQNEYVGALLAGQVLLAGAGNSVREELLAHTTGMGLDAALLTAHFEAVEIVPENKVKAAADLMYIVTNYIVKVGVANITQKQLMAEIKAKAELENLLRAAELKALQSQVNPHFLFNTLNTIARLAMLEGAAQTQEIVYALSDLLRNNLRDIEELRTLEEEVKSITDYLTIQKVRFGDRVQPFIHVDESLKNICIPALSLQPLVENAIIHGLEPKKDGGSVHITGRGVGDKVVITVADTGVGIAADRIQAIFMSEKRTSKGQSTGLGMINVHKRIMQYFGPQFGLRVESRLGEGTEVSICLPYSVKT